MILWPKRLTIAAGAVLAILVVFYAARPGAPLLPPPLNTIVFGAVIAAGLASLIVWVSVAAVGTFKSDNRALRSWLEGQLSDVQADADKRYARLHSVLYGVRSGMQEMHRRFEVMDATTVVLPRQRVVAAVAAPAAILFRAEPAAPVGLDPEVLDLARRLSAQIHTEGE